MPGFARDVVLVTIDTLRADALGFTGNAQADTPRLDELAASGWVFDRAYGHSVMTLPSHANLLTGQLPYQHGVRDNAGFLLPAGVPTAAETFAAAGFRTAAFVAAFPLDARYGLDRGFEVYDDSYPEGSTVGFAVAERSGAEVVGAASEWWRRHEGERRFLWVHLYEPHAPYEPPQPLADRFVENPYLGEVAAVDLYVGRLLEVIAPEGAASEALIVVTSDHGEALGEHGEKTHGLFAYEETLAVPLVLWAERLTPARVGAPVRHIDVLPTMLEAAGIGTDAMPDLAGRSLWRTSTSVVGTRPSPESVYFEALHTNLQRGWAPLRGVIATYPLEGTDAGQPPDRVEAGTAGSGARLLKYIALPIPERYDLLADPAEARNLHAEDGIAAELASLLPGESEWPPSAGSVTEEERRALQSLGYLSTAGGGPTRGDYDQDDDPKVLVELDSLIQEFSESYQDGRLETAEQLARDVVSRRPQMAIGHSNLAQVLLERGKVDEALAVMIRAERELVAPVSLQRQLALTLAEVGRAAEGVRLMERHADSRDPDTLNVLGLVLAEAGAPARAREVLLRSVEVDERNPLARQNLALAACHAGDWRQCEEESRLALALNPELPLSWNYLGISLFNQRRVGEAIDAWSRAVELDPRDLDLLYNLGSVAARSGRSELAREALERFVREASSPNRRGRYAADVATARSLLSGL
ncbi:MAG: sulfatase-like hydrolase/transferase [Acidobacteria bacterium]|nr:sulfatase-like hydrolase/transferase [Acidobacteriota bacterium]